MFAQIPLTGISRPGRWSLARQVFCVQLVVILVVVAAATYAAYAEMKAAGLRAAQDRVSAVASSVAASADVREGLSSADPSAELEPYAEQVRRRTTTSFVVIMSTDGIRYTHPDPSQIGGLFQGHIAAAVAGGTIIETYRGTLGPSVRAVVPVETPAGRVVGLVAVGLTVSTVTQSMDHYLFPLLGVAVLSLLIAAAAYWWAMRWLRRSTQDLGSAQLRRMYQFYDAVLHSVREGVLLLDAQNRLQLVNSEARRLLGLPADVLGRRVDDVGLPAELGRSLAVGGQRTDEVHLTADRVVVVNQAPARLAGRQLGTVVTLRDHTELLTLSNDLKTARAVGDSLHVQAHEAANQLHTVLSLVALGRIEQALEFAVADLAGDQDLIDLVMGSVHEPEAAALLLAKVAEARERDIDLVVTDDIVLPSGVAEPRDLITILGNLIDNALDAAADAPAPRWVTVGAKLRSGADGPAALDRTGRQPTGLQPTGLQQYLVLRVADSGAGLDLDDIAFVTRRGWSTKAVDGQPARGLGLALVSRAVDRYGGALSVTNERGAVFAVWLPLRRRTPAVLDAVAVSVTPALRSRP